MRTIEPGGRHKGLWAQGNAQQSTSARHEGKGARRAGKTKRTAHLEKYLPGVWHFLGLTGSVPNKKGVLSFCIQSNRQWHTAFRLCCIRFCSSLPCVCRGENHPKKMARKDKKSQKNISLPLAARCFNLQRLERCSDASRERNLPNHQLESRMQSAW